MNKFNSKNYNLYANFLNKLANELTKFYYSKLNKTQDAINDFTSAIKIDSTDSDIWYNRAMCYLQLKNKKQYF